MYRAILQVVGHHRTRFFSEPAGEGMCIYLSVQDARLMDELAQGRGFPRGTIGIIPRSTVEDGSSGTLLGLPFIADASVRRGRVFIGYRVDTLEVSDHE